MALSDDVVGILKDEHCRKMDFFIAGLQINGTGLGEVAKQIADSGIAVCGRDDLKTPGRYRATRDELQVQNDLAGALTDETKRALLVHEAVHALSDMRSQKMNDMEAESAAFIAQALYQLKYRGGKKWTSKVPIFVAALGVVVAKQLNEKTGVTVAWDDYAELRKAIQADTNYGKKDLNASAGYNGIKKHSGARCQ
jgi:hypothetical protein